MVIANSTPVICALGEANCLSHASFLQKKNASKTYIVVMCCHALPGITVPAGSFDPDPSCFLRHFHFYDPQAIVQKSSVLLVSQNVRDKQTLQMPRFFS